VLSATGHARPMDVPSPRLGRSDQPVRVERGQFGRRGVHDAPARLKHGREHVVDPRLISGRHHRAEYVFSAVLAACWRIVVLTSAERARCSRRSGSVADG
jgi:hypothetical protein